MTFIVEKVRSGLDNFSSDDDKDCVDSNLMIYFGVVLRCVAFIL